MLWYRVQVGAYSFKSNADRVAADLIEKGFKTVVVKEGLTYKVRVGSFVDKIKAKELLKRVHQYKKYKNAKILEWNDGKNLDIVPATDKKEEPVKDYHPIIRFVAIWLNESDENKFGDAQVFVEYGPDNETITHAILVDTGQNGCDTIKKLKKLGITTLDAVVISHAHGDHYGCLDDIMKQFKVLHLYLPGIEGLKKYQPNYAKAMQNKESKAKKLGIPVSYLTKGDGFTIGHISCNCVYQVPASLLKEHDNHHFVNNQSVVLRFILDDVGTVLLAGDLQNEGNRIVMKKCKQEELAADICKCCWHGDGNAMNTDWVEFVGAWCWYWNYHHAMSKGNRKNTWNKIVTGLKDILKLTRYWILRNYEDGDIDFVYSNGYFLISTSKKTYDNVGMRSRFSA